MNITINHIIMNEKEKRKVEIEFGFIAIAGALGIFLSIFSNAVYDLLIGVYKLSILLVALGSGLLALLFVNFLDLTLKKVHKSMHKPLSQKVITKKIDTVWFEAILAGKKKYELRLADFDINEGDLLRLEEWVGEGVGRKFSGRFIEKQVTYLRKVDLNGWIAKQPELLEKGMYVISFE